MTYVAEAGARAVVEGVGLRSVVTPPGVARRFGWPSDSIGRRLSWCPKFRLTCDYLRPVPQELTHAALIEQAVAVVNPHPVGRRLIGHVGAALVTQDGDVFRGVCIDTGSGTGFCAEGSAIAAMVTARQFRIERITAVWLDADRRVHVLPPCGRCREFIRQIDAENLDSLVVLAPDRVLPLRDLLPEHEFPAALGPHLTIS